MQTNKLKTGLERGKEKLRTLFIKTNEYFRLFPVRGYIITGILCLFLSLCLFCLLFNNASEMQDLLFVIMSEKKGNNELTIEDTQNNIKRLTRENYRLERRLTSLVPLVPYLVINTVENHFTLYQNKKIKREGFCSTGSYIHLEAENSQTWIFKTPQGVFRIQGKTEYPVWRKPDWAFIEEGLPVPPPHGPERFEYGVLGEYALSLGGGYLIHGTLYKRQLGMPVTHGCIRMGDEDLEAIYNNLQIGSKVFIF